MHQHTSCSFKSANNIWQRALTGTQNHIYTEKWANQDSTHLVSQFGTINTNDTSPKFNSHIGQSQYPPDAFRTSQTKGTEPSQAGPHLYAAALPHNGYMEGMIDGILLQITFPQSNQNASIALKGTCTSAMSSIAPANQSQGFSKITR